MIKAYVQMKLDRMLASYWFRFPVFLQINNDINIVFFNLHIPAGSMVSNFVLVRESLSSTCYMVLRKLKYVEKTESILISIQIIKITGTMLLFWKIWTYKVSGCSLRLNETYFLIFFRPFSAISLVWVWSDSELFHHQPDIFLES